jgi:penicillin-binding protein-related factor A (putative recombinase)
MNARPYHPECANRGQGLERALNAQHRLYEVTKRAVVVQQFPHVIRRGRRAGAAEGKALFANATPRVADFMGVLSDGRAVALEAKETHEGRFKLDAVTDGQRDFMRKWTGLGLLLVLIRDGSQTLGTWALPFATYINAWDRARPLPGAHRKRGTASLTPDQFDSLGIRLNGVDWLGAVAKSPLPFDQDPTRLPNQPAQRREVA